MTARAVEDIKAKWIQFDSTVHIRSDVPLAQKIEIFVEPLAVFIRRKYPALEGGGPSVFWLAVFTGILESGTHHKDEVNAAIYELKEKYGARTGPK